MRAGLLRDTITIRAAGSKQDKFGQKIASAGDDVLTAAASIVALSGREIYALGPGFDGQVSHRIVIRFPEVTIRNGMTVNFGVRTFRVQVAMDPDERRRELHLICLETSEVPQ